MVKGWKEILKGKVKKKMKTNRLLIIPKFMNFKPGRSKKEGID
jgi:hypothetical protein